MEIAAHVQAPAPEGAHTATQVARDRPPGRRVGRDQAVGLAAGRLQLDALGVGERVPLAALADLQPDPGPAAGQVDDVGVVALQQRVERRGAAVEDVPVASGTE